jgi:hypothetical protein
MKKSLIPIFLALIFALSAVYICPCSPAATGHQKPLTLQGSHSCCPQNEKNCPPQHCELRGMDNVLSEKSFNLSLPLASDMSFDLFSQSQTLIFPKQETIVESPAVFLSPLDLLIQNSVFLI